LPAGGEGYGDWKKCENGVKREDLGKSEQIAEYDRGKSIDWLKCPFNSRFEWGLPDETIYCGWKRKGQFAPCLCGTTAPDTGMSRLSRLYPFY
jgi:hypothetical protein